MYLDLSSAQGSRNIALLEQIGTLTQLRVLKLRNCGLRDYDIDLLTFPSRLRSLDISHNFVTETGILGLIKRLPAADPVLNGSSNSSPRCKAQGWKFSPIEPSLFSKLTSGPDGYLYIDENLPSAFADLYIAGNFLSIDGLSKVLSYASIE
jgi:hypothetical protein